MERFAGWKTKAEIVEELGISERTLERMLQRKKITRGQKRIPGRKPITVIAPQDVEKLRAEMVQPEPGQSAQTTVPALRQQTAPALRQSQQALEAVQLHRTTDQIPLIPLFLNLKASSRYVGLPEETLKRCIREGKVKAFEGRTYFIARAELERFARQYVGAD
jgi:hypothetical protein